MTLGEYVDLENLSKNPNENLSEIMALLYREVTDNKFDTFKWKLKSRVKLAIGKTEDLFKYYKIKPYNSSERAIDADVFEAFPVQYILGALFFFYADKNRILKRYAALFESPDDGDIENGEDGDEKSYAQHWGWFSTIYGLSKTNILSITGDNCITDLNFIFTLNYLSIDKDYKQEEANAIKQAQQNAKFRK
jgi:hypothetical protein